MLGLWESVSTDLAEWVPKNSTREKSTMVGVNPGELLCAYMCKQCKHVQTCANMCKCLTQQGNCKPPAPFWKADRYRDGDIWGFYSSVDSHAGLLGCDADIRWVAADILKDCSAFRISAFTNPLTQPHFPEDLIPQFSKLLQHTYWRVTSNTIH